MRAILATLISLSALGALSQRIFINQLPEYSQLPPCAEPPLSNIVRNMASGCGDGGKTTSYSCFCVSSSTKFESAISKAVSSKCAPASSDAAASALSVFDKYCHISSLPQGVHGTAIVTAASTVISAQETANASKASIRVSPTPSRTQLGPIPSESKAKSGWLPPRRVRTMWLLAFGFSILFFFS